MQQAINKRSRITMHLVINMLLLFFCINKEAKSQVKVYKNSVLESLIQGEMPKFSDSTIRFFQQRNESATVLYRIVVDTTGFIREFKRMPLIAIGNTLDSTSFVWKDMYSSIECTIKKWKFKPGLWVLGDKKTESELNKYSRTRPYGGYQFFLVFFTANSDIQHNPIFSDIFN